LVGGVIGAIGAAGVGAGLAAAEALVRSARTASLVLFGALGGWAVGLAPPLMFLWTLSGLFGRGRSPSGGALQGPAVRPAAGVGGLGYGGWRGGGKGGGMATPHGLERARAAASTAVCCALACAAVTWAGGHLGGVSLDDLARSFHGSRVGLAPLGGLFGEHGL